MRPCSAAKRLIGRPQESAQSERKSTPRYGNVLYFIFSSDFLSHFVASV
ncbi:MULTISPECIES: hypothetical protein [unclassified Lysinibacillus]|nr:MULTISPECIES: hypothetical protein [unclassified Lysinibacillus]MDM5245891.1 hypothetical protein [Lysinibacillus sp. G4S2]